MALRQKVRKDRRRATQIATRKKNAARKGKERVRRAERFAAKQERMVAKGVTGQAQEAPQQPTPNATQQS